MLIYHVSMTTIHQLHKKYRKLYAQTQRIDQKLRKLRETGMHMQEAKKSCVTEMSNLKTLIDYCMITGEEPTQAQLSHTLIEIQSHVQIHAHGMNLQNTFYHDAQGASTISTLTTSSLTHTGIATISSGRMMGAQGTCVSLKGNTLSGSTVGASGPTGDRLI